MDSPITRAEHTEFLKRMEDEHKRLSRRIDVLEKDNAQNQSLIVSVEKMAVNMENMLKEQQRQGKRLEALEDVPNKSWNTLKNSFISAIGAAIGGAVLAAILYFT